ncbi:MAG: DUF2784 domain-containing protein [Candidatus Delongbacteria bacterium]|nr:DUF2784 domain-containing protein [Candidatus Delongbacteria bacterium]MCG2759607.1 DUF2784 domain-containing protein [Candidatus Delongbacteria bacterium]
MYYRILTDFIVVIHLLFIIFVIFGGFLSLFKKWIIWIHIPVVIWGACVELFGWICPLTPLENWLRLGGDQQGYQGGFIEHYLMPVIYPENLTRNIQIVFGLSVLVINIVVYCILFFRSRQP